MATTPTVELCDDLVAALAASWSPTAPSAVSRRYTAPVRDPESGELRIRGRQVFVFPVRYSPGAATRGEDRYPHAVAVLVVERYEGDEEEPPNAWVDERVDFVHSLIVQGFDFGPDGPPSWNRKLLTVSADVTVCDPEKLAVHRLFYSLVEFEFEELVA